MKAMKYKAGLAIALLAAALSAGAQAAETPQFVTAACKTPDEMTSNDVRRVLNAREKLMGAAADACSAGKTEFLVSRTGSSGNVIWRASD